MTLYICVYVYIKTFLLQPDLLKELRSRGEVYFCGWTQKFRLVETFGLVVFYYQRQQWSSSITAAIKLTDSFA